MTVSSGDGRAPDVDDSTIRATWDLKSGAIRGKVPPLEGEAFVYRIQLSAGSTVQRAKDRSPILYVGEGNRARVTGREIGRPAVPPPELPEAR